MSRGGQIVRLALATVLGAAVPVLVACGSGGANLIPVANAGPLQNDFNAIASAVASGNCSGAQSALAQAQHDAANLPATVDPRLKARITQGLDDLANRAPTECARNSTATQTTTAPTNTQTTTTTTTTTTPTATTPTTTTGTGTTTTPPTTTTGPPPTTTTGPVPDNGGGTPGPSGSGAGAGAGAGGGAPSGGAGAGGTP